MAKRRKSKTPARYPHYSLPQVRAVVGPKPMRWLSPLPIKPTALVTDDRRQWHPERWGRPAIATRRAATRLVVAPRPGPDLTSRIAYADPKRVLVCYRRKTRREVIMALGRGGGGNRPPKRKPTSEVSC